MLTKLAGLGHRAAILAFAGIATTTFLASANTPVATDASVLRVEFEEPQSGPRDYPVSVTDEDSARLSNAPALPADPRTPSRRCGNVGNMMLDMDDLCQYAGPVQAATTPVIVSPR